MMKIEGFPRSVFFLIVVFTTGLFCIWRILKRSFVEFLAANGYNNFNVLIIGAGKVGLMLAEEIKRHPGFGYRIVGFLDDRKTSADLGGEHEVVGQLKDLGEVMRRRFVTKVFITIHPDGGIFHEMLETVKRQRAALRVVPEAFDQATCDIFKYNIGFIPILEYVDLGHNRMQVGKRLFDLVVSLTAVLLLFPAFLVLAALIKLDSRGPVL
jgi:FlaA1/EpsC-like NDP-sugar epimerase